MKRLGRMLYGLLTEVADTVLPALVIAVLINLFVAHGTYVHGQSMEPNLHTDQRLIVEKVSYRLRSPTRGDIVVVRVPEHEVPLIKRVIGLPGETVEIHDGRVWVNGQALDEAYLDNIVQRDYGPLVVPPEHAFVMGDNRNFSSDSRFFGPVRFDQILGACLVVLLAATRVRIPALRWHTGIDPVSDGVPAGVGARFAHINLVARDWERLAAFYEGVFGCTRLLPERDLSGSWLEAGTGVAGARIRGIHLRLPACQRLDGSAGPTLEIFSYHPELDPLPTAPNRPGWGHIAFAVADVAAVRQAVLEAGGRALGETVSTEIKGAGPIVFAYVADPEGNVIELQRWSGEH